MKIHDQNPLGAQQTGSRATTGAQGAQGAAKQGSGGVEIRPDLSGGGPDRVSLSNLAASLGPEGADRELELDRLSELFDRGLYEADVQQVAERLIDDGLGSEGGGEVE